MIVAIQGEPGSFSAGAAHQLVGSDAELLHCESFDQLFAAVADGRAARGVVPVHNTIAGAVYDNLETYGPVVWGLASTPKSPGAYQPQPPLGCW